jgi:hypothetical protein
MAKNITTILKKELPKSALFVKVISNVDINVVNESELADILLPQLLIYEQVKLAGGETDIEQLVTDIVQLIILRKIVEDYIQAFELPNYIEKLNYDNQLDTADPGARALTNFAFAVAADIIGEDKLRELARDELMKMRAIVIERLITALTDKLKDETFVTNLKTKIEKLVNMLEGCLAELNISELIDFVLKLDEIRTCFKQKLKITTSQELEDLD